MKFSFKLFGKTIKVNFNKEARYRCANEETGRQAEVLLGRSLFSTYYDLTMQDRGGSTIKTFSQAWFGPNVRPEGVRMAESFVQHKLEAKDVLPAGVIAVLAEVVRRGNEKALENTKDVPVIANTAKQSITGPISKNG